MSNCGGSCSKMSDIEESEVKTLKISVEKSEIVSKVVTGKHTFYSDETSTWGGHDRFPDPFDYIIGGLGSCIAISIRQYATKHFIMLDRAEITLSYTYDLNNERPYKIDKKIKFFGNLSDEEVARLIMISDSPAQKMLNKGVEIITTLDKSN